MFGIEDHKGTGHQSCLENMIQIENHLRGCYNNHSIIAKQRVSLQHV